MLDFSIIGKNISANRQKLGLTQEALAEILNVTPDYISKIENNFKRPSLSMLEKLADIFKMDIYNLISAPGTDMYEDVNPDIYDLMKNWEPETRRFAVKASETFDEIDRKIRELKQ